MSKSRHLLFSPLLQQLQQRAERSVISQLAFRNKPLTQYLRETYSQSPGKKGSLLASPVFEPMFSWQAATSTMEDLRDNLVSSHLVDALGIPAPFKHQLTAWEYILQDKKSVLVSSGTGSGKTECFMVPILEDLIRQQQKNQTPLSGVQAIFLYPLNALINSQQERLRKFTEGFNGDIRFALYNGETKQNHFDVKEEQEQHPEQILSREKLREAPPSILVTNASMLEYMLVRKADEPIISNSKGMLKYIVLDEAHSYVGSQAAELALLLRRVMEAYGVGPGTGNPIQLIATSATIGEDTPEGNSELAQFLADLAGSSTDRVEVVRGYRHIPSLGSSTVVNQSSPLDALEDLQALSSHDLYQKLSEYKLTQILRKAFTQQKTLAYKLSDLMTVAQKQEPDIKERSLLALLDLMTYAKPDSLHKDDFPDAFVPMRIHAFMRTVAGLWACANPECSHKHPTLQDPSWAFGAIYTDHRLHCLCGSPVFELLSCNGCGTAYLAAEEKSINGISRLQPRRLDLDEDEFMLDVEDASNDESGSISSSAFDRLIGDGGTPARVGLGGSNVGVMNPKEGDTFKAHLKTPEPSRQSGSVRRVFRCTCCGDAETQPGQLFRYARIGAPFFLGDMIPTLLEFSPLPSDKEEHKGPFNGKRLLTFTDSRQGTAKISTRLQLDADRNAVRSLIYHEVSKGETATSALSPEDILLLNESAQNIRLNPMMTAVANTLEQTIQSVTNKQPVDDAAREMLNGMKMMFLSSGPQYAKALENLLSADTSAPAAPVSWKTLSEQLAGSIDTGDRMRDQMCKLSGMNLDKQQFSDFCLYREFGRRPKNTWSAESLGLVGVRYPHIDKVSTTPSTWQQLVLDPEKQVQEWRNFLKIIVDFHIRSRCAVWFENEDYLRWMGSRFPVSVIKGPDVEVQEQNRDVLWPKIRQGANSRILKLLCIAFPNIQPKEPFWKDQLNDLMAQAWSALRPMLRDFESGYQLDIKAVAEFYTPTTTWRCPYTRKALDVTLCGYSPFLPRQLTNEVMKAELCSMPALPSKHWRTATGSSIPMQQRAKWLESDAGVIDARQQGMWPNRSDRIAVKSPWFRLEEHSAQQKPETNKKNEELFKKGKVNVLNCSTTMEMGVDIGDMSAVAMNNVPPAPANYLQRAGRAGRRGESAAAAVTLCKNTAHGMEVFTNPLWPFTISSRPPQVRLDSESIVQRHVNAFALGSYLCEHTDDATKLSCQWFFEAGMEQSQRELFVLWLQDKKRSNNDEWSLGVVRIVKGTRLAHLSHQALVSRVIESIDVTQQQWQAQLDVMLQNRDILKQDNSHWEDTPAGKSVMFQLRDFRRAYLFSKLASEAFLPGYGFPVGVVTFNYRTAEELGKIKAARQKRKDEGVKESFSQRFENLPSRDLPTALREYSPGADVVLGGKVYRSSGVMLGKVLSSGQELKEETQHLPWLWYCRDCGAGATSVTFPRHCSHCGEGIDKLEVHRYLQPIGFTSDIRYKTHNDVNRPTYVAYKHPRVLLPNAEWIPMVDPSLGRYRLSNKAEIFSYSDGQHGEGYAVCLSCGRAEAQTQQGRSPVQMKDPEKENTHTRLRGGSQGEGDKLCRGHVQNDLWLGYSARTDVVEIQLKDADGHFINDEIAARSLAIALREGLARLLGVENREIGVTTQQVKDEQGIAGYSILLFDQTAGGAGFSIQITENWKQVFELAENVLNCSCDSACHHCILGYDSQHFVDLLDHSRAAPLVSKAIQQRFDLDPALRYFGSQYDNECESLPLSDRLRLELAKGQHTGCGIQLGGDPAEWDLSHWQLLDDVLNFALNYKGNVRLVIPRTVFNQLESSVKTQLGGLLSLPTDISIEIVEDDMLSSQLALTSQVLAWLESPVAASSATPDTTTETKVWASDNTANNTPGEHWGQVGDKVIVKSTLPASALQISGRVLTAEELQPALQPNEVRISFHHELDCKLDDFGAKFWQLVGQNLPDLTKKINDGVQITKVTFNDRFLKSPITVRLLGEIVTDLVKNGDADQATLQVSANQLSRERTPSRVFHDWCDNKDREQVLNIMLDQGHLGPSWGGAIDFFAGTTHTVEHARELEIHFDDGCVGYVLFDYGLGYWQTEGPGHHNFSDTYERQVERLANSPLKIKAPDSGLKSYLIAGFK